MSAPVLDEQGLRRTLGRIAHEILEGESSVDDIVLLGIQSGGARLAERIADSIEQFEGTRPPTGAIDATLHRDDLAQRGLDATPRPSSIPDIEGRVVVPAAPDVLPRHRRTRLGDRVVEAAVDAQRRRGLRQHQPELPPAEDAEGRHPGAWLGSGLSSTRWVWAARWQNTPPSGSRCTQAAAARLSRGAGWEGVES